MFFPANFIKSSIDLNLNHIRSLEYTHKVTIVSTMIGGQLYKASSEHSLKHFRSGGAAEGRGAGPGGRGGPPRSPVLFHTS